MATIGILVPCSPGHLNPMNSLGLELTRRGHRVVVAGVADAERAVRAAGLEFEPIGVGDYPPGAMDDLHAEMGRRLGTDALKYTLKIMGKFAVMVLRDAPAALRGAGVDFLLVDQAASGGTVVAERLDLPFVTVANALMFNHEWSVPPVATTWPYSRSPLATARNYLGYKVLKRIMSPVFDVLAEHRKTWGLPARPDPNDSYSKLAQVAQHPAAFEFPRRHLPPHFHFAGPFQDPRARAPIPFPFEALDGRPLVYASLGTLQNRLLWIFRAIAEACDGLGVQLVISLGGSAEPEVLGKLPGSPIVVRSAPQLELLERAALAITHAGLNTALESLARGVPMVAIPITNDQPGVAARIAWTGSGLVIPPSRLTVPRLRSAVSRVLAEPSFAENAGRLREAIRRSGGVGRAADVVEREISTGAPVLAEAFEAEGAAVA